MSIGNICLNLVTVFHYMMEVKGFNHLKRFKETVSVGYIILP